MTIAASRYLPGLLGLPCSLMERTLNRARRIAPQAVNANAMNTALSDATVERVEDHGEDDQQRSAKEVVVGARVGAQPDRVEPAEDVRERDRVGNRKKVFFRFSG